MKKVQVFIKSKKLLFLLGFGIIILIAYINYSNNPNSKLFGDRQKYIYPVRFSAPTLSNLYSPPPADQISTWQTYTNNKDVGWSLKYPPELKIAEYPNIYPSFIIYHPNGIDSLSIQVRKDSRDYYAAGTPNSKFAGKDASFGKTDKFYPTEGPANLQGRSRTHITVFPNDKDIVTVEYFGTDPLFDLILSTFKFTQ